jgi:hypothetical protein
MDINVDKYITTIDCDDTSCSLRYKLNGETIGVMRYQYYLNVGRRIKQNIVVLREMDIDRLLGDIMITEGLSPELGESVVINIKEISYRNVNTYVQSEVIPNNEQPTSD